MAHITYESITVNTVVALTTGKIDKKNHAEITIEANPIRFRVDGINPTADEGILVGVNGVITLEGSGELTEFRAVPCASSAAAILRCNYDLRGG